MTHLIAMLAAVCIRLLIGAERWRKIASLSVFWGAVICSVLFIGGAWLLGDTDTVSHGFYVFIVIFIFLFVTKYILKFLRKLLGIEDDY